VRVLHLGKFYPPAKGGMETILALIAERTSPQVDNRVLVANAGIHTVSERRAAVNVVRVGAVARIGAVAVCPGMPAALARERADVIVLHEPNPMALVAYFLARPEARLIVWYHSDVIRPSWRYRLFYRPFLRFALRRADRIVVSSPTLGASAPELRDFQAKCAVIPFGVEAAESSPRIAARATEIRNEAGGPIMLFVGRMVRYKGIEVLLEACAGLGGRALIVGDGPERAPLEAMAKERGLGDRVRFLGPVEDAELRALYSACDIFVLPSITRQEAFGVVQLEAMMAGKPVVSTDLGTGVGWVNQHGETGLVVPPRDAPALREALRRLLEDEALRHSYGEAAARRARTTFTVDRMIDAILALYAEVCTKQIGAGVNAEPPKAAKEQVAGAGPRHK
jgi:glycosyltransferase involved in cell wall biosynthesis